MGYADEVLSRNLAPAEAYREIHKAMWTRHFPSGSNDHHEFWRHVNALSRGERAFIITNDFYGEVHCNGFDGYFSNTECQQAHDTANALELFGLQKAAEFLRRATMIAQIPGTVPPDYTCDYDEERTGVLQKLDSELYGSKALAGFEQAVVDYVRRHPDEFA